MPVLIGTAGWSLPKAEQQNFVSAGSHLERYATKFPVAEINSSFHRSHRAATWIRWRDSVPASFRFSVKMPKSITHTQRLGETDEMVRAFLDEAGVLGSKLGCVLVQLPPSLAFDRGVASKFFSSLREQTQVTLACEPRHETWFNTEADELLTKFEVARVAADPPRVPGGSSPGGWRGLSYYRLHGSPRVYYSAYEPEFIAALAARVSDDKQAGRDVWLIFDNTTLGAATRNARELAQALTM
jgi:uncharacterized protein YecE (DUF72 family)